MKFTPKIEKELIFEFILFCIGIISLILFYNDNVLTTFILIMTFVTGLLFWYKDHDVYFYAIGGILGPVAEIICIKYGVWSYSNPTFLNIPMWLPFAWGLVVMLMKRIAESFIEIKMK